MPEPAAEACEAGGSHARIGQVPQVVHIWLTTAYDGGHLTLKRNIYEARLKSNGLIRHSSEAGEASAPDVHQSQAVIAGSGDPVATHIAPSRPSTACGKPVGAIQSPYGFPFDRAGGPDFPVAPAKILTRT